MAEKKSDKKIVDVQHPGKSTPSDNSKSVIVPSRPIMKDPMVVEDELNTQGDETKIVVKTSKSIKPLSEPAPEKEDKKTVAEIAVEAAAEKEDKKTEAKPAKTEEADQPNLDEVLKPAAHDETSPENPEEPEEPEATEEEKPAEDEEKTEPQPDKSDENEAPPAEGDQGQPADKAADEQSKAEAEQKKKEVAVQKLVDSKQYFLPINSVEQRKSKRFVALGILLSLLLAVAWVDIALDAGLIDLGGGVKPVTHFFSN